MATILKTKSGTYKAVIKQNGKHLKSRNFKLKRDAVAWAKRIEADEQQMIALGTRGTRMTLGELIDVRMADPDTGKRKDIAGLISRQHVLIKYLGADRKLTTITPDLVTRMLDDYAAGKARRADGQGKVTDTRRQRSPATVNRLKATLSGLLKFAMGKHWLTSNPCAAVPNKALNNERERYLTDDERKALLAACSASEWSKLRLLVLMALMPAPSYSLCRMQKNNTARQVSSSTIPSRPCL